MRIGDRDLSEALGEGLGLGIGVLMEGI